MYRVRRFEERGLFAYSQQKIRGFFHVYIGQEAIAGALATGIRPEDKIVFAGDIKQFKSVQQGSFFDHLQKIGKVTEMKEKTRQKKGPKSP